MKEENPDLTQDEIFEILSNERRRFILFYLKTRDSPVRLMELVEELAAQEEDTEVDAVPEQARKRVYVSLYQTHVPRLEEVGLITYDPDTKMVSLANEAGALDTYLDVDEEGSDVANTGPRWYLYYIAVVGANLALLVASSLQQIALASTVITYTMIISLAVVALIHALYSRRYLMTGFLII